MKYGIRELKDGGLSRAVQRASLGEEIVITDRGRPVAKIVPYGESRLPSSVAELIGSDRMELRIPVLDAISPVVLLAGRKSAVQYVGEQRR